MIQCTCIVQEGQSPDLHETELREKLTTFAATAFDSEPHFNWVRIPPGNGFTAGKPSTSSVVSMIANRPLSAEHREQHLRELVALWTSTTSSSVDEIVAVIADPANA